MRFDGHSGFAKKQQSNAATVLTSLVMFFWLILSSHLAQAASPATDEPTTDLRILVDVSGSMKKNDPNNLRRDALRLLVSMLPETSRAGIWSFGKQVNMQVKPGFADKVWKKRARAEADKIHSRGLFTNIEDTLTKSTWDWKNPDPLWDRHLILLTDGMVDVSKQAGENEKSRKRILGKILAKLKSAGVKVHTIALSKQADHELLDKIAQTTDGWFEAVESADRLQRLFLRLFEKTTKMDSLPLEENRFDVDDSISDMTLLIFRKQGSKPTSVTQPDNVSIQDGKLPGNVEWYSDKGFDIVTVHNPMKGTWKIEADYDKDNRVKAITNLKLRVSPLPNNVLRNESVKVEAVLIQDGGKLEEQQMLDLITMQVDSKPEQGKMLSQSMTRKASTSFEAYLENMGESGRVDVVVKAVSPTFRRESRHEVKVHESPVKLELGKQGDSHVITVTENPELIQVGTLRLALTIEGAEGAYYVPKAGAHRWQAVLDKTYSGRAISITAQARLIGDREFKSNLRGRLPEAEKPLPEPLNLWVEQVDDGLMLQALLTEGVLQTGTLQLTYKEIAEEGTTPLLSFAIIPHESAMVWQKLLPAHYSGKQLTVYARASLLNGKAFEKEYTVSIPEVEVKEVPPQPDIVEEKKPEPEPVPTPEPEPVNEEEPVPEETKQKTNWWLIISILVVSNLFIFVGGYYGYKFWQKRYGRVSELDDEEEQQAPAEDVEISSDEPAPVETGEQQDEPVAEQVIDESTSSDDEFVSERREEQDTPAVDLADDVKEEPVQPTEEAEPDTTIDTSDADDLPEFDIEMDEDVSSSEVEPVAKTESESEEDPWAAALDEQADAEATAAAETAEAEEKPTAPAPDKQADAEAAVAETTEAESEEDPWAAALDEQADAEAAAAETSEAEPEEDPWAAALDEQADAEAAAETTEAETEEDPWAAALDEQADAEAVTIFETEPEDVKKTSKEQGKSDE